MIEISNLLKTFGGRAAVNGLSFRAADSAITGLLGANGAGKSTTLRIICGVLTPEAGRVVADDCDSLERRRHIGALLDHAGLYARLSVRENLEYFGRLRGLSSATLHRRVDELITQLGLEPLAARRAAGLSQGERMKVALGRAMLHNPRNLIFDEPTTGLDVPSVRSLREILRRLRDGGACIIFSSHILDEARALCDHVVIIRSGCLADEGSPTDICRRSHSATLEDAFIRLTTAPETQPC
jgi:sodium transport system ATP-binding protein